MMIYRLLMLMAVTSRVTVEAFLPSSPNVRSSMCGPSTFLLSTARSETSDVSTRSTENESAHTATKPAPKVHNLRSLEDFLDYIDSAPKDSLAVVKFYANSCPMCKRIEVKYKKMARFYQNAPIQFAEIAKTAHPDIFPTLNVQTYPFIQIYRNGQCVASHGTESDKTFEPIVHDTIQRELLMSPQDWESFLAAFEAPIRTSK